MDRVQRERVQKLASNLEEMLKLCGTNGANKTAFVEWVFTTAQTLAQVNFGEALLHTIGYVYERAAQMAIDKGVPIIGWVGAGGKMLRKYTHDMKMQFEATDAAYTIMKDKNQQEMLQRLLSEGNIEEIEKMLQGKGNSILDILWKLQVVDIERTIRSVCETVLSSKTNSREQLVLKAKMIKKMGKIFRPAKKKYMRATSFQNMGTL